MKIVRFRFNNTEHTGVFEDSVIRSDAPVHGRDTFSLEEVSLLNPVTPTKIVLVGLNYRDHAAELDMALPENPIIFLKPTTSMIGPGEVIIYPSCSKRVDYEAELALVIGKQARNIRESEAEEYIGGYTCFNDVTARDIQKQDGQWTRAKSFDTFAPVGPWVETELDPSDLAIRSYLNGELKQDSRTSEFIFKVPELVSFVSSVMTLYPGDLIVTGTPSKIGPMNPGDEITIEIEGIGRLTNSVAGRRP